MKKIILKDLTTNEFPWLDNDIKKGTIVYEYTGCTYGVISPEGISVSYENGICPFFEVPRNSVSDYNV